MAFNAIIFNVNLAFLLHIYQPPTQEHGAVKEITETSYAPILKTIKNKPYLKLTLNIPLSLSYLLHVTGSDDTLGKIKELFEAEKIELTSTGAYHPLLTKIPDFLAEQEIVLNERGLAYYFGKNKGFEGEDALMVKDIVGFFPPEAAINSTIISQLDAMGYTWVFADDVAVPRSSGYLYNPVYHLEDQNIKIVTRHKGISDMLSFKRFVELGDLIDQILFVRQEGKDLVLALDGEFFGHHYDEGISLLESMVEELNRLGINLVTVKELVSQADSLPLKEVVESSWGANLEQVQRGEIYPLWEKPDNEVQKMLWELQHKVGEDARQDKDIEIKAEADMFDTFPLWDLDRLSKLEDVEVKNEIFKHILLLQSLHSDQFWWASNQDVGGKMLYAPEFVHKALDLYKQYATVAEKKELLAYIEDMSQRIESIL